MTLDLGGRDITSYLSNMLGDLQFVNEVESIKVNMIISLPGRIKLRFCFKNSLSVY